MLAREPMIYRGFLSWRAKGELAVGIGRFQGPDAAPEGVDLWIVISPRLTLVGFMCECRNSQY